MTARAIAGLLLFDVALTVVGLLLLLGLRGFRTWADVARLVGVGYLAGFAAVAAALSTLLAVGIPFGWPLVIATCAVLAGAGAAIAVIGGRPMPAIRPRLAAVPQLPILPALFMAAFALYFEALFRATRLQGLSEWDAWRCWALRAKAIWLFDGLDDDLFGAGAARCPGYPPGLATIEASAFDAMGGTDVATYTLQSWVLALAFVAAVAGLLARRVPAVLLLPFLLLAALLPSVTDRIADGRADLPLAFLVVVAAVLVCLWLDDHEWWRLATASLLMAGAVLVKREGLLLVVCVLAAAAVASHRERRFAWPRLAAAGAIALLVSLPWRVWLAVEGAQSGAPPGGYLSLRDELDRAWPSTRLVVETMFDYDLWLAAAPLAIGAAALALFAGARRAPLFVVSFAVISAVACAWVIWADSTLELTQDYGLNPVVRLVGGPVLVLAALTPLVLSQAWAPDAGRSSSENGNRGTRGRRRTLLPWAIVLVAVAGYPLSAVAGVSSFRLPGGMLHFPSADECVVAVRPGEPVRVVLAYAADYGEARSIARRGMSAGADRPMVEQDGCGRLRVFVERLGPADARLLVGLLATVGLDASLEGRPRR